MSRADGWTFQPVECLIQIWVLKAMTEFAQQFVD